jgi:arylsulfatase A
MPMMRVLAIAMLLMAAPAAARPAPQRPPNIVIILADDLGYGDIGVYGQKTIRTPHIDRLARQGIRLTDYYSASNLCTPARAGLLTGRYPVRTGLGHEVIQAKDTNGLPQSEVTLAEALKPAGYATALIGKWHLGHVAPYWPPRAHGFDVFFGLPYSHDMKPLALYTDTDPGVDYVKDDTVDFATLTRRFSDQAAAFIDRNAGTPFFLMLAHTAPHLPLVPHPDHKGRSPAHAYGDVVEELDASVGRVLAALKRNGLDRNTLVIVTSDNGPWFEGDTGGLHDRKGGAGFDGGYRVPFIARLPSVIPANRSSDAIAMGIDIFPTVLALAGFAPPPGIELDGRDMRAVLKGGRVSPHAHLVLFNNEDVAAIRTQRWKLVARAQYRTLDIPLDAVGYTPLFDMATDPGERFAANQSAPDMVAALRKTLAEERARFAPLRTRPPRPFTYGQ